MSTVRVENQKSYQSVANRRVEHLNESVVVMTEKSQVLIHNIIMLEDNIIYDYFPRKADSNENFK
jgi:hypothetical protein